MYESLTNDIPRRWSTCTSHVQKLSTNKHNNSRPRKPMSYRTKDGASLGRGRSHCYIEAAAIDCMAARTLETCSCFFHPSPRNPHCKKLRSSSQYWPMKLYRLLEERYDLVAMRHSKCAEPWRATQAMDVAIKTFTIGLEKSSVFGYSAYDVGIHVRRAPSPSRGILFLPRGGSTVVLLAGGVATQYIEG